MLEGGGRRDTLSPSCQVFPLTCDMLRFPQEIAYSNPLSAQKQPPPGLFTTGENEVFL